MFSPIRHIVTHLLLNLLFLSRAMGQAPPVSESEISGEAILATIALFDHPQYQTRESATRQVIAWGAQTIPYLVQATESGHLERSTRAMQILTLLAEPADPLQENPAWSALELLAEKGVTERAKLAKIALQRIADRQHQIAIDKLSEIGVKVEQGDINVLNKTINEVHLRVDHGWRGTANDLRWVSWLTGVRYAVVCGPAIDVEVLKYLSRMRDLRHVFLSRTTSLRSKDLAFLRPQSPLEELGLFFFDPGSGLVEQFQKLTIVGSIFLVGIPDGKVLAEELAKNLPFARVMNHPGAVLGVRCAPNGPCTISTLIPNSGAEVGGLQENDTIVRIGDKPIRQFEDLRQIVANLNASKVLPVEVVRLGQSIKLEITLGEMHP